MPSLPSALFVPSLLLAAVVPGAATLADRVLIIRNTNSAISRAVADDYSARRGVTHVLDIQVPDAAAGPGEESIGFDDFQTLIGQPLRTYLSGHPGIDFIVMTKGVPLRLYHAQDLPCSVDSYVAALDYDQLPGAVRIVSEDPNYRAPGGGVFHGVSWANRFWNSKRPFSHAEFGGYLVTRLDGYTQDDAMGLTTRSLAAEAALRAGASPTGPILLDQDPGYGYGDPALQPYSVVASDPPVQDTAWIPRESEYGDWNTDMYLAADSLKARNLTYLIDSTETFRGNEDGLMGYASWGSNDHDFNASAYASLGFAPGGIAETAVSTSARTFLPTRGGQSLVADLIKNGVTGVKGYSDEPFLQAIASPSILFSRYTAGWTLAESFYAASNQVGWEDIVIGDPILRAYPATSEATVFLRPAAPRRLQPGGGRAHTVLLSRGRPGSTPVTALGRIASPR